MELPPVNLDPPFNITRASHTVLTARDLDASRRFYTEVIGLLVTDETDDVIYLRGTEETCHHSLTLKRAEGHAVCERLGFRVFRDSDLDAAATYFDRLGRPGKWLDLPFQTRTLLIEDDAGTPIELCSGMSVLPRLNAMVHSHRGGAARRMDHYQVLVPDVLQGAKFYAQLGFRVSDQLHMVGEDKPFALFMYRKNNPWDMVLLTRPGPRMHHMGYVVESTADMLRACDVAANLGLADRIEHGPARHGCTHSYFVYLRDPDGHRIELLLPAVQMVDVEDVPVRYEVGPGSSANGWGPHAPQSWIDEGSPFPGVSLRALAGTDIFSSRANEPVM